MVVAGTYTYVGATDDVTTTVVTNADPLGRVVVECEVTTTGGGVVMVLIVVVEVGLLDDGRGCVVGPLSAVLVQEPKSVSVGNV